MAISNRMEQDNGATLPSSRNRQTSDASSFAPFSGSSAPSGGLGADTRHSAIIWIDKGEQDGKDSALLFKNFLEPSCRFFEDTWTGEIPYREYIQWDDYHYRVYFTRGCFNGGRGQGKTSAMRSFAQALEDWRTYRKNDNKTLETLMKDEDIDYVYAIPPIDPTVLEDKDSIMAMILSHLFYQAEEK